MRFASLFVAIGLLLGLAPASDALEAVRYRDHVFSTYETTSDLKYGEAVNAYGDEIELLLDVLEPAGDRAKNRAAVVWVHGGYFVTGSKTSSSYLPARENFVKAGYVTFSINYRLRDEAEFPYGLGEVVTSGRLQDYIDAILDAQHDAQAAIRWVRAHAKKYRIDPNKVAIAGHSAGGITAQQVAYNDHDPGNSGTPGYSSRPDAAVSSAGSSMPLLTTRIDPLEPPLLMTHGLSDNVVPFTPFSCAVAISLLNTCELVVDPDQAHGMFGYEYHRDFLYRHLIAKPALRPPVDVDVTGFPS